MTLIYFRCRAPRHRARASRTGTIVVRHGTAAFCPADFSDDPHEWEATGGVSLESLLDTTAHVDVWENEDVDAVERTGHLSHAVGDPHPLSHAR